MRFHSSVLSFSLTLALAGTSAVLTPLPVVRAAEADQAICAVCGPREGAGLEPVRATATYKGKNYSFCSTQCKVEFLQNPNEFLVTDEGKPAPAFTLKDLSGKPVSLADYKGKVVLADFWGTNCPPCIKAMPYLQSLHEKYGPKGFAVLGLSIDEKTAPVAQVVKRTKVTYPIAMANAKTWSAYKINALPSLVLIGRDGRIVKRYGGEADKKAMEKEIEKALAAGAASERAGVASGEAK
ncbi:MAG: redoxin family protein [Armatimonadetes bacterium]|nr:redoxin family protein [Armatimonadota bacterium]